MPKPSLTPSEKSPWAGTTLAQIANAGLVSFPLNLVADYRGSRYDAIAHRDGTVVWNGRTFHSLSTSAANVRLGVMGKPEGRPYPQTNGWTFWHFRDADGTLRPMDLLRRRLHAGRS